MPQMLPKLPRMSTEIVDDELVKVMLTMIGVSLWEPTSAASAYPLHVQGMNCS